MGVGAAVKAGAGVGVAPRGWADWAGPGVAAVGDAPAVVTAAVTVGAAAGLLPLGTVDISATEPVQEQRQERDI